MTRFARLSAALEGHRRFAALTATIIVALVAFAGTPAAIIQIGEATTGSVPKSASSTTDDASTGSFLDRLATPLSRPPSADQEQIANAAGELLRAVKPPPPEPAAPEPPCSTDVAVALAAQIRARLADVAGTPLPGDTIEEVADFAAGCSDKTEAEVVLDVALELLAYVPDAGLPHVDLPNLPPLPQLPIPPEVIDALGPASGVFKEGCGQLGTVALLLLILPPAANLPVSQGDLIQFLAPANALCALFDDGS